MMRTSKKHMTHWLLCGIFALLCVSPFVASAKSVEPPLKPEAGETLLSESKANEALETIQEWFKSQPCLTVDIKADIEGGLLGKRTESGKLTLKRPDNVLRRFTHPKQKAVRLLGAQGSTYDGHRKRVIERDYTQAPKLLKLLRSVMIGDIGALRDYFTFTIFKKKADAEKGTAAQWRLVLTPSKGKRSMVSKDYSYIQARINEGEAFFSEIDEVPKGGRRNRVTQYFTNLTVLKELNDEAFKDDLLDAVEKEEEAVEEMKETNQKEQNK